MKDTQEYIVDFTVPGMIHALTIRSPISHGTLNDISIPSLPASYHLITAKDIPGENCLADFPFPVLADKDLSYIGQPVAILAGKDESRLLELASNVIVSAEETPLTGLEEEVIIGREIKHNELHLGDEEKIISGTYFTGIQEHWYAEPHGALAIPPLNSGDENKTSVFEIYTATQWPYHVKRSVSRLMGLDGENVVIVPTLMTEHLDGKIWYPSLLACHAALAALVSSSPVKIMLTREEDFMYSPKRNAAKINIQSRLGEKGEILASKVEVNLDLGSDGIFENEIIDQTCLGSLGLYRHQAFCISGSGKRTNIPPQGPLAGFGLSQGLFAMERHASRIADSLGKDPAEWRKENFLQKNMSFAIGKAWKYSMPLAELVDKAASMSDYYRKWASYELLRMRQRKEKRGESLRGIGITTAYQGNGLLYNDESNCTIELTLGKDGFLDIKSSIISSGTGYLDTWRTIALEILGVEPDFVRVKGNTLEAPDSGPGVLSRNIAAVTSLLEQSCIDIRDQRFRDPLPITVKNTSRPSKTSGWVPGKHINTRALAHPGWAAAVVEIEMDPVSLEPEVRGIWLAIDCGRILNKHRLCRTLKTSVIQALGWTCSEHIIYENGKIPDECYRNYNILVPEEIPLIEVDFINEDSANYTGAGDLPFNCVPASYAQAVSQAMDHHFDKIPLTLHDIWDAWKLKQTENPQ